MKHFATLALSLLCSLLLSAQQFNFTKFRTEQGLAQSEVTSIEVDSKNRLWLGTLGGISIFSGKAFSNFSTSDNLAEEWVTCIFPDPQTHNVWVGHYSGNLSFYNSKSEQFEPIYTNKLFQFHEISCITRFDSTLFIGSKGGGVAQLDTDSMVFRKNVTFGNNLVIHDFEEFNNSLYCATSEGVFKYASGKLEQISNQETLDITLKNRKILGITENRLFSIHQGKVIEIDIEIPKEDKLTSVIVDKESNKWIGTSSGNLIFSGKDTKIFSTSNGLETPRINSVFCDKENNLWIGSNIGLDLYQGEAFVRIDKAKLGTDLVWDTEYLNGHIFLATSIGLFKVNASNLSNVERVKSLEDIDIRSLHSSQNVLYIGTENGQVHKYLNGEITHTFNLENSVNCISGVKRILCGTESGLYEITLNGDSAITIPIEKHKNSLILDIEYLNEMDEFWVSTWAGGIYISKNDEAFKRRKALDSLNNTYVFEISQGYENAVWLGAYGKGLYEYKNDSLISYKSKVEFASSTPHAVFQDTSGKVWIGSNNGLEVFLPETGEVQKMTRKSGFTGVEVNPNSISGIDNGVIFFGTLLGLEIYRPELSTFSQFIPYVEFKSLKTGGIELFMPSDSVFPAHENNFSFNFQFNSPGYADQLKYEAKLDPIDKEWRDLGKHERVSFTSLRPGKYTLRIRGSHNQHYSADVLYPFTIEIPFYERTWFYLAQLGSLIIMFFAALIYGRKAKGSRVATILATIAIIILFEWILNTFESNVEEYARGIAFIKISLNVMLALALFPIEHYLKRIIVKQ